MLHAGTRIAALAARQCSANLTAKSASPRWIVGTRLLFSSSSGGDDGSRSPFWKRMFGEEGAEGSNRANTAEDGPKATPSEANVATADSPSHAAQGSASSEQPSAAASSPSAAAAVGASSGGEYEEDLEEDLEEDFQHPMQPTAAGMSGAGMTMASRTTLPRAGGAAASSPPPHSSPLWAADSAHSRAGTAGKEEALLAEASLAPRGADSPEEMERILETAAFRQAGFDPELDTADADAPSPGGAGPDDLPYPREALAAAEAKTAKDETLRVDLGDYEFEHRLKFPVSPRDRPDRRVVLRCRGGKQGRAGAAGACPIFDARSLHFNNLPLLERFLKDGAMLRGRRETGLCAKCQRMVAGTVGRARHIGVLPTTETFGIFDAGPPPKVRTFHEPDFAAAARKFGSL